MSESPPLNTKHLSSFISEEEYAAIYPQVEAAHKQLEAKNGPGSDFLGWMTLPRDYDKEEFARIKAAAAKIREDSDVLVVAGIGGSYLGARAVVEAVKGMYHNELEDGLKIYFCGNSISPTYLNNIISLCKGKRFSINVISKSGTTTETSLAFRVLRELLEKEMGVEEANKRIYATTDRAKGTLKQLADAQGWPTFVVPDDVGGRYSVLSAVGLLPIAAAGIDIDALMQGAADAMERFSVLSPDNDAYKYAAIRNILYRKGKAVEILECYEPDFTLMNEWYKQLFGESEGKDNKGLFPASCIFSTDLHSMGQFIQEGSRTMFETIVDVRKPAQDLFIDKLEGNFDGLNFLANQNMSVVNRKAMEGTILAHTDGGVPLGLIEVDSLSAHDVGELIYFFWRACAVSGYLLSVNPFDQPGVESYKKNMFALLGKPEGVWATLDRQRGGSRIDDYSLIVLEYPGIRAQLRAGMLVREPGPRFAVYGTDGAYVKYGLDPQEDALRHRGAKPAPGDWCTEDPSKWGVLHDEHGRRAYPTVTGNYMRFYDRVRDTLREGKAPAVTHEQMLWDMQILEAAFESDRTGSTIRL